MCKKLVVFLFFCCSFFTLAHAADNEVLKWPVPNFYNISSCYGEVGYGRSSPHYAIDIAAPTGTDIVAAADGVVVAASYNGGYGVSILLRHDDFGEDVAYTRYSHLSEYCVKVGEDVSAGAVIGYVGNTGFSTDSHLDFELYVGGQNKENKTDPGLYLELPETLVYAGSDQNQTCCSDYIQKISEWASMRDLKSKRESVQITIDEKPSIPSSLVVGTCWPIRGKLHSDDAIGTVTVGVFNQQGSMITGKTQNALNTTDVNLSDYDAETRFDLLEPGDYVFEIRVALVSDPNYLHVVQRDPITIVNSDEVQISLKGVKAPQHIDAGDVFSISGIINSNIPIEKYSAGVYDFYGYKHDVVTGAYARPNSCSGDLSYLDPYLLFDELKSSVYIYRVSCICAGDEYVLLETIFTVN